MVLVGLVMLGGCAVNPRDIGREPHLSPVGSGVQPQVRAIPIERPIVTYGGGNSTWRDNSADLFRDARAMRVGDLVTVTISIKDKATIDSSSNRSRNSENGLGVQMAYDIQAVGRSTAGTGAVDSSIRGSTASKGEGEIKRSESIELRVAAVVTDILPNGNLVISGTQEVRVNFEVRVLGVAGIVRPRDISTDNTIAYDKIAEARISYGGRGRITEIQQPGWGQQIVDILAPF